MKTEDLRSLILVDYCDLSGQMPGTQLNQGDSLRGADVKLTSGAEALLHREQSDAEVLLRSAAYAAFQAPLNGVLQLFDRDGKKGLLAADSSFQLVAAPTQSEAWSRKWHLEQIGTGLGMIVPLVATHKLIHSAFPSKIAGLASEKGLQCLTNIERRALLKYEITTAVGTGAVFGGVLTPSKDFENSGLGRARFDQALSSALTFGTLATASAGIKSLTSGVKSEGLLGRFVKSESLATALAGIPAGIVAVDSHKLLQHGKLASWDERFQSMYTFSVMGAGLGKAMRIGKNAIAPETMQGRPRAAIEQPLEQLERGRPGETGTLSFPDLRTDAVPREIRLTCERGEVSLPRLKKGVALPERFDSQAHFEELAIQHDRVPARVYRDAATKTEVIVPEDYALKLDRVAELQKQAKLDGPAGFEARKLLAEPQWAEFAQRMTPQDVFQQIQMTPRPSRFQRIILSDEANPYDPWYASEHRQPGFRSSADSVFASGETTWYARERGPGVVKDTLHEWVHHEQKANQLDTDVFMNAARLENPRWPRDYAQAPHENFAITLGEYVLHPEGAKVSELLANAPLRSAVLGQRLRLMLEEIPTGERGRLHDQLLARADLLANRAEPIARRTLVEMAQGEGSSQVNNAMRLLLYLGKAEDFAALPRLTKLDLSMEPITDVQAQNLRLLPSLRELDLSNTFISDGTLHYLSNTRLEVLNLRKTKVTNSGLASLPQTLRSLDISGTYLGDPAVAHLLKLPNLGVLDIQGTKITHTGLGRLTGGKPNLQILD